MRKKCIVEGCDRPYFCKGLCSKHYKYGGPLPKNKLPRKRKYGASVTNPEILQTYTAMKQRCFNRNNPNYIHYGARGIKVCDRWLGKNGFNNFAKDMGERPEGHSLDRIDVNGDYSPENCRWATRNEQAVNTTRKKKYSQYKGVTFSKSENMWKAYLCVDKHNHTRSAKTELEAYQKRLELEREYLTKH